MNIISNLHYIAPYVQALFGGLVVLSIRNDHNEVIGGVPIGRSAWTAMALLAVLGLLSLKMTLIHGNALGMAEAVLGTCIAGYILTAPHGQVLAGPHQKLPASDDDPVLGFSMMVTGHSGGWGDVMGWPTWSTYVGIRYVLPCAALGLLIGSTLTAVSGLLIVASYWPVAYIPAINRQWDTRFFGAFMCGVWLYLGL